MVGRQAGDGVCLLFFVWRVFFSEISMWTRRLCDGSRIGFLSLYFLCSCLCFVVLIPRIVIFDWDIAWCVLLGVVDGDVWAFILYAVDFGRYLDVL